MPPDASDFPGGMPALGAGDDYMLRTSIDRQVNATPSF